MDLNDFQQAYHFLLEGNVDTPSSSDDEYTHRTELLKMSINAWANDYGILWNELWTALADASDGDKTIAASTVKYDMPTDFRFLGGKPQTYTTSDARTYWKVYALPLADLKKNISKKACYVTGNKKGGYDIHFLQQPTENDTIEYPYYKEPFEPSSGSDVIEMADPWFAVNYALSKGHEIDGDGDRAVKAMAIADEKLTNMKIINDIKPGYESNVIQDVDFVIDTPGFGR